MSGRLYPNNTTLGSFFSAYTKTSKLSIQSVQSFNNSIVPLCSTFFSIPSLFNTSFLSFIGGVYFSYNTDTKIPLPFTPFLIDASNMNTLCFAQRYFQACVTFYISFFFSLCTNGFNSNILVLSSRVYYSNLLSFFFFNIISTCMLATLSEVPSVQISFLRKNVVLPE